MRHSAVQLRNKWSVVPAVAVVLTMMATVASADKKDHERLDVGDTIPRELGHGMDGKKMRLDDVDDVPMVITFWASWCPPCRKELPVLESVQQLAGVDKLKVVAINLKEQRRVFRSLSRQFRDATMAVTHDRKGRLAETYGVHGIPHLILVNRDRTIAKVRTGYNEEEIPEIVDDINALIAANALTDPQ